MTILTLYCTRACSPHSIYSIRNTVKGFTGSNNYLCSAQFPMKWAASADLGCQTMNCQSFGPFSLDCLHDGLHKQMDFHNGYNLDPGTWKIMIMLSWKIAKLSLQLPFG